MIEHKIMGVNSCKKTPSTLLVVLILKYCTICAEVLTRKCLGSGVTKTTVLLFYRFVLIIMSLPPWRSAVARALHRNRSLPNARYLQLATIDSQGYPANRTVVFRGWQEPQSNLQFVTDLRSAKIPQVLHSPQAEACWYFPKTREQFRLRGKLEIVDLASKQRLLAWQQLSAAARSQFFWPPPGEPRLAQVAFATGDLPDDVEPPESFGLLLLIPQRVDFLELRGEPQNRCLYELCDGDWSIANINP
jgi:pyridoxamine 5'-phosphate oxidase